MKIEIENLKALVYGFNLTDIQKMSAIEEFVYLKKRIEYLEQQINKNAVIGGVMPCFPADNEIKKAADEWERKASCGAFEGGYINDDFIAGVNWLKSFLNKA